MSEKRKDNKGRVLKAGESQRANGTYMYRYSSYNGVRKSVYAKTLEELRKKEDQLVADRVVGFLGNEVRITVSELIERLLSIKTNVKPMTMEAYRRNLNGIKKTPLSKMLITEVTQYDAKYWCISMHESGKAYYTVDNYRCFLRMAFDFAVENDWVKKNPFTFRTSSVIPETRRKTREGLTPKQQKEYFEVLKIFSKRKWYVQIVILVETGIRIGELCGLTISDINFEEGYIDINKQVYKDEHGERHVGSLKTASAARKIPMSPAAREALREAIAMRSRLKIERVIEGHSGFIFINQFGKPLVSGNLEAAMNRLQTKYEELYGNVPKVVPHTLRHTFCTNMIRAGMDTKSVQYLMGHATAEVTLNVYTHFKFEDVKKAFEAAVL